MEVDGFIIIIFPSMLSELFVFWITELPFRVFIMSYPFTLLENRYMGRGDVQVFISTKTTSYLKHSQDRMQASTIFFIEISYSNTNKYTNHSYVDGHDK